MRRPTALMLLSAILTGCSFMDHAAVTVAPHLGQTAECVPYRPLAADAKAWLDRHPEKPPASWAAWRHWLAGEVQPKLAKDCE